MKKKLVYLLLFFLILAGCDSQEVKGKKIESDSLISKVEKEAIENKEFQIDTSFKTIHIFVALCDNKYQGIVPVPASIGNGQDPNGNLYWGAGYGVRTYFKKSSEWKFLESIKYDSLVMERIVFKHVSKNYYIVADAYNGKHIKKCIFDFFESSCGKLKDTLTVENNTIGIKGYSSLVSFIGHDGLMEFDIGGDFTNTDQKVRDVIILSCVSKDFFGPYLKKANINPLVWTTNLMGPEAYTIHDALSGYVIGENNEEIRTRAAKAYSKYTKCSEKAARNLLVTGW